jgi:hypothetical protein
MSWCLESLDEEIAELKANFSNKLAELEARRPQLIAEAIAEEEAKAAATAARVAALRASLAPAAPTAFLLPLPASENVAPPAAPAQAVQAIPSFFKLILSSGKAVGIKAVGKTAPLRVVEASNAQVFKLIPISSGPHAGFVELEAVGGRQAGKLLDNSHRKNSSLTLYKRHMVNNPAQRWKLVGGKLSSAVSGMFMAKGDAPGFGFSESGDTFTFAAAEPPAMAPAAGEVAPAAVAQVPKPKRTVSSGSLAWEAFRKHAKATMPERFAGRNEMEVAKEIKDGNMEAYNAFVQQFKVAHQAEQGPPV